MEIIVVAFLIAFARCYICMIFGDDTESSGREVEEGLRRIRRGAGQTCETGEGRVEPVKG